ncbi:unnamed protein product [Pleuronectes platessa]|uniref:Uncharacterized protein n=1 Tax=Pleuronectes platessa TaxID=8262 RepID=A0A9N7YMY4_PLEPL|nr:unnamed protein product [Pleuronectes platessa]
MMLLLTSTPQHLQDEPSAVSQVPAAIIDLSPSDCRRAAEWNVNLVKADGLLQLLMLGFHMKKSVPHHTWAPPREWSKHRMTSERVLTFPTAPTPGTDKQRRLFETPASKPKSPSVEV